MSHNIKEELWWITISVAIAVILWLNVRGERLKIKSYRVSLNLSNLPAGLEIVKQNTSTVDVYLEGPGNLLDRMPSELIEVVLDISSAKPGKNSFTLTASRNVILPSKYKDKLTVIFIQPERIEITTKERKEEKL